MFSLSNLSRNVLHFLNRTLVKGGERSSRQNVRCAFSNAPHDRVYDHVLVCAGTSQVNLTRQTDKLCIKARCVLRPVPKLAQGSTGMQHSPELEINYLFEEINCCFTHTYSFLQLQMCQQRH